MTVIISGSNGFIGSALVKKYFDAGYNVISIVKDENENIESIKNFSTIVYNDFSDTELLKKQLEMYNDAIFYHLAWIGVNGQLKADYNSQIKSIKMMCDAANVAASIKVRKFLVSGTIAEKAVESFTSLTSLNGGMMYAASKSSAHLFIEAYCKNIGLDFVWMQFSNIYGPKNKTGNLVSYTLEQLNKNMEATFGPANQPYDFIYVDDLIEAVYRLGIKDKLTCNQYFIGSGTPKILKEYLVLIGRYSKKEELIKIGVRSDDGIKYDFSMFDTKKLLSDIGEFVSKSFDESIQYTIKEY